MGGGFSNILGHVAQGFTEQANIEKQKDFLNEMQHRAQVHDLLMGVINNPNSTPEAINAATGGLGELHSTPGTKQYKFDPYKIGLISKPGMAPRSVHIPGLTAPAPPPGGQPQPTFSETSQALPAGVSGPPQLGAPQMSIPQAPPGLLQAATAGAGGGTVTTPLGGTQNLQYTPEQHAALAASALGQAQQAQVTGAAKGREQIMAEIQQLPPDQQAMVMGNNAYLGMLYRSRLAGQKIPMSVADAANDPEVAHLLQASGIDPSSTGMVMVTHDKTGAAIKAEPYTAPAMMGTSTTSTTVDPVTGLPTATKTQRTKTLPGQAGGGKMSTPVAPPGVSLPTSRPNLPAVGAPSENTIGGRVLPAAAVGIISSQARNYERSGIAPTGKTAPIVQQYMEENGMVPHTTQQVADYQKGFDKAMNEDKRFKMMSEIANKIAADPNPENIGSFDVALSAYHTGMTIGQIQGMRSGKFSVEMPMAARSLPESIQVGIQHVLNGGELSPEQRQNFVDLAKQSRQAAWTEAVSNAKGMGFARFPQPTPGLPPLGLWPGVVNKTQLTSLAKDHHISYGDARKQAVAAGMNVQD